MSSAGNGLRRSIPRYMAQRMKPQRTGDSEINFILSLDSSVCQSERINGEVIWSIYEGLIMSKTKDFDKKIDLKIISSIISKYCFSMYNNP